MNFEFIAIEGPIGVGKTSLARRLSQDLNAELILEQAGENPFLELFYSDPARGALPTQLHFLLQRANQLQNLRQSSLFHAVRVSDYMLEKDRLFAHLTLNIHELRLYQDLYKRLFSDVIQPDLIIYLQAPVPVLLDRIKKRGIMYEQSIDGDYLRQLIDLYTDFFFAYDKGPLLTVNAGEIDLVNNDEDYATLLDKILSIKSGRHYFNPVPTL